MHYISISGEDIFKRKIMAKFVTPLGNINVTIIGHASVMIDWNGRKIITDPYGEIADYTKLPVMDLILITHDHYDHLDPVALRPITGDKNYNHIYTSSC
jgi:L-ascorbate metabolism protein UlaG (beta-lactamase superfamily)